SCAFMSSSALCTTSATLRRGALRRFGASDARAAPSCACAARLGVLAAAFFAVFFLAPAAVFTPAFLRGAAARVSDLRAVGFAARDVFLLRAFGITLRFGDDPADTVGHQKLRIEPRAQRGAQIRRRNFELRYGFDVHAAGRRAAQILGAERPPRAQELTERAGLRREPAGAVRDDEMRKLEQLLPAMPVRQAQERVHAEQQAERPRAVFRAKALERIDRVGDAAACDLAVVRDEPFVTRNGRLNHAQAQLRLRDRRAAMRRRADRHEVNALEAQPLLELERRAQMPVVDRI